jgi:hypothetical protein
VEGPDGHLADPDFDRWYPLLPVMSRVTTRRRHDALTIPTIFLVASEGPTSTYIGNLYARLPLTLNQKRLHTVEGSVCWMLSHPRQGATLICAWFAALLPRE